VEPSGGEGDWYELVEAALLAILEASDEALLVFDRDGRCRMIGRRAGEMFGLDPAEHVGRARGEVLAVLSRACEKPGAFLSATRPYDALATAHTVGEIGLRGARARTVQWSSYPMEFEGRPLGQVTVVRDVTREQAADPRTELTSAHRFRQELEREHARCARAWDSYAIVRIAVDGRFDEVAACLAGRRAYDVVARLDPDEVALLLPGADAVAAHHQDRSAAQGRVVEFLGAFH
jgi:hypothetical protein